MVGNQILGDLNSIGGGAFSQIVRNNPEIDSMVCASILS
jgi:hypothetical protein